MDARGIDVAQGVAVEVEPGQRARELDDVDCSLAQVVAAEARSSG